MDIQIRFLSYVDPFCFEFHLNPLSGAVEAGINAIVTGNDSILRAAIL